jgi:peptidoglycan DL-endopeptidase CwlO
MLRLATLILLLCALAFASAASADDAPSPTPDYAPPVLVPSPVPELVLPKPPPPPPPLGTRAVDYARHLLGVPYRYGGNTPASGFDCSGFVRYVYEHLGVTLPRDSYSQFDTGHRVRRGALRPGDLVFFNGAGHVGIYVGADKFIHAPHTGTVVQISSLDGSYGRGFDGARRIAS